MFLLERLLGPYLKKGVLPDPQCDNVGICLWKTAGDSILPEDISVHWKRFLAITFSPLKQHIKFRKWWFIPNSSPGFCEAWTPRKLQYADDKHAHDTVWYTNTCMVSEGCHCAKPRVEIDPSSIFQYCFKEMTKIHNKTKTQWAYFLWFPCYHPLGLHNIRQCTKVILHSSHDKFCYPCGTAGQFSSELCSLCPCRMLVSFSIK